MRNKLFTKQRLFPHPNPPHLQSYDLLRKQMGGVDRDKLWRVMVLCPWRREDVYMS